MPGLLPLTPQQRSDFLDKAAMMAMSGLVSRYGSTGWSRSDLAAEAFCYAQALLAERDRRTEEK